MCLVLLALEMHPDFPFIYVGNRDEFFERPTSPAALWNEAGDVFGGRDLQAGGTWLGVTKNGRFACVTNFRRASDQPGSLSRGALARDFLLGTEAPVKFLERLAPSAHEYSGFNLLIGTLNDAQPEIWYFSNRQNTPLRLKPGAYGLSNHLLDTPWPKVESGKQELHQVITQISAEHSNERVHDSLRRILLDQTMAPDDQLPDTGIGLVKERSLSSRFISLPDYGTRASTVITVNRQNEICFSEQIHLQKSASKTDVQPEPTVIYIPMSTG